MRFKIPCLLTVLVAGFPKLCQASGYGTSQESLYYIVLPVIVVAVVLSLIAIGFVSLRATSKPQNSEQQGTDDALSSKNPTVVSLITERYPKSAPLIVGISRSVIFILGIFLGMVGCAFLPLHFVGLLLPDAGLGNIFYIGFGGAFGVALGTGFSFFNSKRTKSLFSKAYLIYLGIMIFVIVLAAVRMESDPHFPN